MSRDVTGDWAAYLEQEGVRRVIRAELRREPLAALARRAGVRPNAIRAALRMSAFGTRAEDDDRLAAFCRRHPAYEPDACAVGLAILLRDLPAPRRPAVRERIARALYDEFQAAGAPLPGWLEDEVSASAP